MVVLGAVMVVGESWLKRLGRRVATTLRRGHGDGPLPCLVGVCEGRAASELVSFLCFDFFFLCQWGQADLEVSKIFRGLAIRACPLGRPHMGGKEVGFKSHATISLDFTNEVCVHKWKESSPWMLSYSCFSSVLGLDILCGKWHGIEGVKNFT